MDREKVLGATVGPLDRELAEYSGFLQGSTIGWGVSGSAGTKMRDKRVKWREFGGCLSSFDELRCRVDLVDHHAIRSPRLRWAPKSVRCVRTRAELKATAASIRCRRESFGPVTGTAQRGHRGRA